MARGKKAGHIKPQVTIKDEMLAPYYISMDETQYTLMIEGSTLPLGYYSNLEGAIKRAARYLTVESLNQQTIDLTDFLKAYDNVITQLNNRIPV